MSEPTTERKRRSISPAEKAQAALDVNTRRIASVKARIKTAQERVDEIKKELPSLERRQEHLLADPDLPPQDGQQTLPDDAA